MDRLHSRPARLAALLDALDVDDLDDDDRHLLGWLSSFDDATVLGVARLLRLARGAELDRALTVAAERGLDQLVDELLATDEPVPYMPVEP